MWLARKDALLSRHCAKQFLGFADDQLKRMSGKKGRGKKGQRPEIETKFGYDVKAAMHTLRLLYECKEIVSSGNITLPRPERDLLIRVRTGKYSMEKVFSMAQELFAECEAEAKQSTLPEKIDRGAVSRMIADCYRKGWDLADRSNCPICQNENNTLTQVIQSLHQAGFHAFLAGGCVRDLLLAREPADYDVATDATPDDVMRIFPKTYAVGAQFGVVLVAVAENETVEVATFRSDMGYSEGRHPTKSALPRRLRKTCSAGTSPSTACCSTL